MKKTDEIKKYKLLSLKNIMLFIITLSAICVSVFLIITITKRQEDEQRIVIDHSTSLERADRVEAAIQTAQQNIIINEIHSGDESLWVELYNPSSYEVDVEGYLLSINGEIIESIMDDTLISDHGFGLVEVLYNDIYRPDFNNTVSISLLNTSQKKIDSVNVKNLSNKESYGRQTDGKLEFQFMKESKGKTNNNSEIINKEYPVFSVPSGFYDVKFELKLYVEDGYTIYYTTDGSAPNTDSKVYDSPIIVGDRSSEDNKYSARLDVSTWNITIPRYKVDKSTIVRAIAVDREGVESEVVTETYYVGYSIKAGYLNMPVLSIIADEDNLFDYWKGMYVTGARYEEVLISQEDVWNNSNYWLGYESPAYIQLFEDNTLSCEDEITLSLFNDTMLYMPQKSWRITGINRNSSINSLLSKFIPNNTDVSDVILSADRNDTNYKIREALIQKLMEGRAVLTKMIQPCIVFLNGEYWGLYNIHSDYSNEYIAEKYNLNKDDILISKAGSALSRLKADQASIEQLYNFINETDFSISKNYDTFKSMVDINSLIDYYCCMIYTGNSDWISGNYYIWRTKSVSNKPMNDGKWRWILSELDSSCSRSRLSSYSINTFKLKSLSEDIMFSKLIINKDFMKDFKETFYEFGNEVFSCDRVESELTKLEEIYKLSTVESNKRFYGTGSSTDFINGIGVIKEFFEKRMEYMGKYILEIN